MSSNGELLEAEINSLVEKRSECRLRRDYVNADSIKQDLEDKFGVEITDFADGSCKWQFIQPKANWTLVWSDIEASPSEGRTDAPTVVPLVVATVDTPHYKVRLRDTLDHLQQIRARNSLRIRLEPCHMLDLCKHPFVGSKRILMEGWRQILVPRLLSMARSEQLPFVLVAEDDVRLPEGVNWGRIIDECTTIYSQSSLDILSLGHAWSGASAARGDLCVHLRNGGGIHGTTLLAIRIPGGALKLQEQLEQNTKSTHWDQYLFHSKSHDLRLGLSDPPLVGWSEVEQTLTASGTGNRRRSGGRLAFLPPTTTKTKWVERHLVKGGAGAARLKVKGANQHHSIPS